MTAPSFEGLLARPNLAWMGQNTTHLEPPAAVTEALIASTRAREFQFYAPALGFDELRQLIVDDLGLPTAQCWITDGAVGGLHHICTALSADISQLVTTDPGWPWPGRFAGLERVPVRTVDVYSPDQDFRMKPGRLAEVIEPKSLIYLIDPLNPLGSSYPRDEFEQIAAIARDSGSLIVHDCTYRHFATGHSLLADLYPEGTFTTYSFSKWLGLAGLRLGAVVAAPELLTRLTTVPSNPLGANIQAQRAAIAGLHVKAEWLATLRATNAANQQLIIDAVRASELGSVLVTPSHGNFIAVDVSGSGRTSDEICQTMLDDDVFIRPGTYQSPGFGERFVKISTSVPTEWAARCAESWSRLRPARESVR